MLEHLEKLTEADHPDLESMPLITGILGDLIKSTQPGIEAAENKVKFWSVTSSLVFQRGDIIVSDICLRIVKTKLNHDWDTGHGFARR